MSCTSVSESGPVWVPNEDTDLQIRLEMILHTSDASHCGREATGSILEKNFFWFTLRKDISIFVISCIDYLSTIGGDNVPRDFGPSLHGTKPNDLLKFEYISFVMASTG